MRAGRAVPTHAVNGFCGTTLLEDEADCVGEADGVVRGVGREEEHVALANDDVAENAVIDNFEHHGTAVLVEPLRSLVDMVVGAGVGPADDLGCIRNSRRRGWGMSL